jgi:hypothetical protein
MALSCTSAGVERGSDAGTRRWPANVNREAIEGRVAISVRSWSRAARHSTLTADIDGVLNSLAAAPVNPAGSKQRAVSQRASKRTAIIFNAIAPRRARISKEFPGSE